MPTIPTADLQVGMFVHLDLGWMSHPFALSSFRIAHPSEIATIRSLGLAQVRWSPDQSDFVPFDKPRDAGAAARPPTPRRAAQQAAARAAVPRRRPSRDLDAQRVEQQHAEASRDWRAAAALALHDAPEAGRRMGALARALVHKMIGARDLSIRAVALAPGDRASHALNVGVLTLLMGRQAGLSETELHDLGTGALAHDLGKLELPPTLQSLHEGLDAEQRARWRDHVALGVALGRRMDLAPSALLVIGQHHEHMDGSGFPQAADGARLSMPARLVALVNRYDNLCQPGEDRAAMTPHDALSLLFTQGQRQFDPPLLNLFVRMMGVYPPGSVVQLTDDRLAVVESVSAARPLKPTVSLHDPAAGSAGVLLLDLAREPALGIRRALAPADLTPAQRAKLAPGERYGWFFLPEADAPDDETKPGP